MCRQLAPTTQGIPIEIYAFSNDKVWVNYERITSDIFDHLLASISYFDLECFELTSTITESLDNIFNINYQVESFVEINGEFEFFNSFSISAINPLLISSTWALSFARES